MPMPEHQLQRNRANQLEEWSQESQEPANQEKQHTEMLLELLPEEEWISMRDLYPEYKEKVEDPVHKVTLSTYLRELRSLGYVEMKGRKGGSKYRRADRPIQEVRDNYMSPLSEGTPVWLNRRIKEVVEDRLETMIENMVEDQVQAELQAETCELKRQLKEQTRRELMEVNGLEDDKETVIQALKQKNKAVKMSEIYSDYKKKAQDPKSRRTVRRHLKELSEENLVIATGGKSGRKYKAPA